MHVEYPSLTIPYGGHIDRLVDKPTCQFSSHPAESGERYLTARSHQENVNRSQSSIQALSLEGQARLLHSGPIGSVTFVKAILIIHNTIVLDWTIMNM